MNEEYEGKWWMNNMEEDDVEEGMKTMNEDHERRWLRE
jgi:hypothetical protein